MLVNCTQERKREKGRKKRKKREGGRERRREEGRKDKRKGKKRKIREKGGTEGGGWEEREGCFQFTSRISVKMT